MCELPIIFNTPMVRSVLEGNKTNTRRPIKIPTEFFTTEPEGFCIDRNDKWFAWGIDIVDNGYGTPEQEQCYASKGTINCPYGKVGDILYVRETFKVEAIDLGYDNGVQESGSHDYDCGGALVSYKTDNYKRKYGISFEDVLEEDVEVKFNEEKINKAIPSIHMPKWASRIKLEIKDVRIERVQDISLDDCVAEGVGSYIGASKHYDPQERGEEPDEIFINLWNSIYNNWNDNPWVWVVGFKVIKGNK